MRHLSIFSKCLLVYLLVPSLNPSQAQQQPDSLFKVNDSIMGTGRAHDVNSTFDLPPLSFYVDYNYSSGRKGGLVGDDDQYFHGKITVKPHMSADTVNHILNVALDVKGEILEKYERDGLGSMQFELKEQDVTYAQLHIARIKVYMSGEKDTIITWKDCLGGDIKISNGMKKLKGLEVVYEGHELMVRKTLFFGDAISAESAKNSIPWKWILPPIIIILGAIAFWKLKRRAR